MKKITIVLFCLFLFLTFGCNKQSAQRLLHDEASCQKIAGVWEQRLVLETEISMNPDNPSEVSGVVTSNSITTLTLNTDQHFSIETRIEFVSYEPKDASVENEIPLDAMKEYFSQKVFVKGLFLATDSVIQYDHETVVINDSVEMLFEEFAASNPSAGTKIQTVSWRDGDDYLYLLAEGDVTQTELVYTRVK